MGFIEAFVYAHHQHRQDSEKPGNFGDFMKGRIRFMTAITPAYAHAYQATCLAPHIPGVPHQSSGDLPMEELILCVVLSSPPRLIPLSLEPELNPTTPLKIRL